MIIPTERRIATLTLAGCILSFLTGSVRGDTRMPEANGQARSVSQTATTSRRRAVPHLPSRAALTVSLGSGGGSYTPGSTVHIWADATGPDSVFDRWTGDTAALADPNAWHTSLLMPAVPVSLLATYKSAPRWAPTDHVMNGLPSSNPGAVHLIYFVPPASIGMIFRFHGSGGSAVSFFSKVEDSSFARDAVASGFAVAALDSLDRVNKQWSGDATNANTDVLSVQGAIAYLKAQGLIGDATPLFGIGMSNGGGFAPKAAYYLGFRASANVCSSGSPAQLFNLTSVPNIWSLAQADDQVTHPTFLPDAQSHVMVLQNRGIANELRENPPSPVYPMRFARIAGITLSDSQAIFQSLDSGGFLDANHFLQASPDTNATALTAALPAAYSPFAKDILEQLNCCYSEHQFFSDFSNRILAFFKADRGPHS